MAQDPHGLGGVREAEAEVSDRERPGDAGLSASVAPLAVVAACGDVLPRQRPHLSVQARLVGLDHQQVVGVLLLDQEARVGALGMQGVGGDGDPGQVVGLQEGGEAGDLVGLVGHRLLGDGPALVGHRGCTRPRWSTTGIK